MKADSEGSDQTARMRSLIRAFAVRICTESTSSHGPRHTNIRMDWLRFWDGTSRAVVPKKTLVVLYEQCIDMFAFVHPELGFYDSS